MARFDGERRDGVDIVEAILVLRPVAEDVEGVEGMIIAMVFAGSVNNRN